MNILRILLTVLGFVACSTEKIEKQGKSYLHFSADLTVGNEWQVISVFESISDHRLCKTWSMDLGTVNPSKKKKKFILKESGDTLKVPLFWDGPSFCSWKFKSVFLQEVNESKNCWGFPSIVLYEGGESVEHETAPKIIEFICEPDSRCVCKDTVSRGQRHFRLREGSNTSIHIKERWQ